jgi:hypothetical protein
VPEWDWGQSGVGSDGDGAVKFRGNPTFQERVAILTEGALLFGSMLFYCILAAACFAIPIWLTLKLFFSF